MKFFSADWHLSHFNCVKYCNRPFSSVEEMNQAILDRTNEKVSEEDTLYFLGDFAFDLRGDLTKIYSYRNRVVCKNIIFILGNHDHLIVKMGCLAGLKTYGLFEIQNQIFFFLITPTKFGKNLTMEYITVLVTRMALLRRI